MGVAAASSPSINSVLETNTILTYSETSRESGSEDEGESESESDSESESEI